MKKRNLNIDPNRLSLNIEAICWRWLQIDITNLELKGITQISVNLDDIENLIIEPEKIGG